MHIPKSKKTAIVLSIVTLACVGVFSATDLRAAGDKPQPASSDIAHDQNESLMMRVIQMERAQDETGMGVQRHDILRNQPAE